MELFNIQREMLSSVWHRTGKHSIERESASLTIAVLAGMANNPQQRRGEGGNRELTKSRLQAAELKPRTRFPPCPQQWRNKNVECVGNNRRYQAAHLGFLIARLRRNGKDTQK
jgi:hypothetical protein